MYCSIVRKAVKVAGIEMADKTNPANRGDILQKKINGETNPADSKSDQVNKPDDENACGTRKGGRGLGRGGGKGRRDGTGGGRGRGGGGKGGRQRG
jgi:hypothetical protein